MKNLTITEKMEVFRALLEKSYVARLHAEDSANQVTIDSRKCTVTLGKKYAKVDVGSSGKYMVELDTCDIYGIKGYGVIHRGHQYGSLDTLAQWDWSGYTAVLIPVEPEPEPTLPDPEKVKAYEAKIEAKRDRALARASKARAESTQAHERQREISSHIPFGQPIHIGHHSEGRHRRDLAKMNSLADKACQSADKASYYEQKAESIGTSGISSDDPSALLKLKEKLAGLEQLQDRMKQVNKALRIKDEAKSNNALMLLGYTADKIASVRTPDFCGRIGFPSYATTNNGANIRTVKARIAQLEKVAIVANNPVEVEHDGVTYLEDDNRIQIIFPGKPSEEIRKVLKGRGFKWSPSRGAWVRMLNDSGRYSAKCVLNEVKRLG